MSVFTHTIAKADLPVTIAAGVPATTLGEVRGKYTITEVNIVAEAAMTGATATARTLTVYNRGQAGAGTTVVASLAFIDTVDLVANDKKALTLTATAADLLVADGDVLECVETVASTGTVRPEAVLTVLGIPRA
jgi:hypothetical protein